MQSLVISPKYETLKEEIKKLRIELSIILLEYDNLRFTEGPNLETEYMLELGELEYKIFKKECEHKRIKRKIEMIQAKINRQEKIDLNHIDKMLDIEFEEYLKELETKWDALNYALARNNMPTLSKNEAAELKRLYRLIVKKLHPDLNPNVTEKQLKLYENAVMTYKNGDIKALKIIANLIDDENLTIEDPDSISELEKVKNNLLDSIDNVKEDIENLKSIFPFNIKRLLVDRDNLTKKKAEYHQELIQYEEAIHNIKNVLDELLMDININGGNYQWVA